MDLGVTDRALEQPAVLDVLLCQRVTEKGFRRVHWLASYEGTQTEDQAQRSTAKQSKKFLAPKRGRLQDKTE